MIGKVTLLTSGVVTKENMTDRFTLAGTIRIANQKNDCKVFPPIYVVRNINIPSHRPPPAARSIFTRWAWYASVTEQVDFWGAVIKWRDVRGLEEVKNCEQGGLESIWTRPGFHWFNSKRALYSSPYDQRHLRGPITNRLNICNCLEFLWALLRFTVKMEDLQKIIECFLWSE